MKRLFIILCIGILGSCSLSEVNFNADNDIPVGYEDIMVYKSNHLLFADIDNLRSASTKSDEEMVSLESLLERDSTKSITFKHYKVSQIPFLNNRESNKVALTDRIRESVSQDSLSVVKTFLIETTDTLSGEVMKNVATMIPDAECMTIFGEESISFLDKSTFTGIILYSELDGEFADVYVYSDGPIKFASQIPIDFDSDNLVKIYLSIPQSVETKSDMEDGSIIGGILDASFCFAYLDEEEERENPEVPIGSGGGGGSGSGTGTGIVDTGNFFGKFSGNGSRDKLTYTINLTSSDGGSTKGGGVYSHGKVAVCNAVVTENSYIFDRWTGDFRGKTDNVVITVTEDVESTAYFRYILEDPKRPCWDSETGTANPLVEMELAPTNKAATNLLGSTFGMTRSGGSQFHSGLDLYADPGTPIYSMFDGVVTWPYVTEQPLRNDDGTYPLNYSGDIDGSGNRLYIRSTVNGSNISVGYWHLMENSPVAINPRTGMPFKVGDTVFQGELIAYSGRTGNAHDVDNPHLHLVVKNNSGTFVDPESYINGKVLSSTVNGERKVSSVEIVDINCDDEENEITIYY